MLEYVENGNLSEFLMVSKMLYNCQRVLAHASGIILGYDFLEKRATSGAACQVHD